MIYRVSSEGEKGWTEIEATNPAEASQKFQQETGREAAQILLKQEGWGCQTLCI